MVCANSPASAPLGGDLTVPCDASDIKCKHPFFVAVFPFCCSDEVVRSCEEDDVLAFGYLCAGVQNAVELLTVARSVFVADVFCEDLWRDVLDVFSSVVDDWLGDAVGERVKRLARFEGGFGFRGLRSSGSCSHRTC